VFVARFGDENEMASDVVVVDGGFKLSELVTLTVVVPYIFLKILNFSVKKKFKVF
jgi:hypothetical protein